jgi:hypothetical protein
MRFSLLLLLLIAALVRVASAQGSRQNPSPMTETTRPHTRIEKTEAAGRRITLQSLKGATAFTTGKFKGNRPVPLILHFHGAPWLIEHHVARHAPSSLLITVQLGAGSSAYGTPFTDAGLFARLIAEAGKEVGVERGWSSITLTGFSAGYGAVRAILRDPENYKLVNNVLLLDGIHASYLPEQKVLADGGSVAAGDLDSFVTFAKDAATGNKTFVLTHSEIFPGTFASTTECVDHLLRELGTRRRPDLREGPMGMQQLSSVRRGKLYVFGYAGNSAPDHIDHLHAMPFWFRYLGL